MAAVQESKTNNPNIKLSKWLGPFCKYRVELYNAIKLREMKARHEIAIAKGSCFMETLLEVR